MTTLTKCGEMMIKTSKKSFQIAGILFAISAIMATIAFNMGREVEEEILTPAPSTSTVETL